MKKQLITLAVFLLSLSVFGQFRLASDGFVTQLSNPNDSTYIVSVKLFADLTGSGYLPLNIQVGYRIFSQRGQLYRVSAADDLTFSSATLTIIEVDNDQVDTEGLPIGQVQVYNPGSVEAIPQVPYGTTGAAAVLQAAVISYNSQLPGGSENIANSGNFYYSDATLKSAAAGLPNGNLVSLVQNGYITSYVISATALGYTVDDEAIKLLTSGSFLVLSELITGGTIDVRKLGVDLDGVNDQTAKLQSWINQLTDVDFKFPAGEVIIERLAFTGQNSVRITGDSTVFKTRLAYSYGFTDIDDSQLKLTNVLAAEISGITFTSPSGQLYSMPAYGNGANIISPVFVYATVSDHNLNYRDIVVKDCRFKASRLGAVYIAANTGIVANAEIRTYNTVTLVRNQVINSMGRFAVRGNVGTTYVTNNQFTPDLRINYWTFENSGRVEVTQESAAETQSKAVISGNLFFTAGFFAQNVSDLTVSNNTFLYSGYYTDALGALSLTLTEAEYAALPITPPEGTVAVVNGRSGGVKFDNAGYAKGRMSVYQNNRHFGSAVDGLGNLIYEGTDIAAVVSGCQFDNDIINRTNNGYQRHLSVIGSTFGPDSEIDVNKESVFTNCNFLGRDSLDGNLTSYPPKYGWSSDSLTTVIKRASGQSNSRLRFEGCTFENRRIRFTSTADNLSFDNCDFQGYTTIDFSADVVPAADTEVKATFQNCSGGRFLDRSVLAYTSAAIVFLQHDSLHANAGIITALNDGPNSRIEESVIVGYADDPYARTVDAALTASTFAVSSPYDVTGGLIESIEDNQLFTDRTIAITRLPKQAGDFSYHAANLSTYSLAPFVSHTGPLAVQVPLPASANTRLFQIEIEVSQPRLESFRLVVNVENNSNTINNAYISGESAANVPVRVRSESGNFYVVIGDNASTWVRGLYSLTGLRMNDSTTDEVEFASIASGSSIKPYANLNNVNSIDFSGITPISVDAFATESQLQNATGWAEYRDNGYTVGAPFQLVANVKRTLPNNSSVVVDSQKPTDVTEFYTAADSTITGRNGDGVTILVEFTAKPTSVAATYVDVAIDIGGAVGEIYPRTLGFPKGTGVARNIIYHVTGYTLGTWEANGGKIKVVSDGPVDIYNIRHVITRTHKAR